MAGRLAWILAGGAAIVGGMAFQGSNFIHLDDGDGDEIRRAVEDVRPGAERDARVKVIVDGERHADVEAEAVKAMTSAVGRLVRAEAALAIAQAGDDPEEIAQATERRDRARALVDKLAADIERQAEAKSASAGDPAKVRVRDVVRDEVRAAIRD